MAIVVCGAGACRGAGNDAPRTGADRSVHCAAGEVASRRLGCVRVAQLSAGEAICALLTSGQVLCWGNNKLGQLGDGTGKDSRTPVVVEGLVDAVEVSPPCARRKTGQVVCWGRNDVGQVEPDPRRVKLPWELDRQTVCDVNRPAALDAYNVRPRPVPVRGIEDAVGIATGYDQSCALRASGVVVCWGDNSKGQLGTPVPATAFVLQEIPGIPKAVEVAVGVVHSCARTADGSVWCWGANRAGELGTPERGPAPRQVPGVRGAVGLELGGRNTCARAADGSLTCWGDLCGIGAGGTPPSPVEAAGKIKQVVPEYASCSAWCALRPGGEVDCTIPPLQADAKDAGVTRRIEIGPAVGIAGSGDETCALQTDGQVMCWRLLEWEQKLTAPAPVDW